MLNKPFRCGIGNRKAAADLSSEVIGDFCVRGPLRPRPILRVIQSECAHAFSLKDAARACAGARGGCCVSLNDDGFSKRVWRDCAKSVARRSSRINAMASVRLLRLFLRSTLTVRSGTSGNTRYTIAVAFDHCGEFVMHKALRM